MNTQIEFDLLCILNRLRLEAEQPKKEENISPKKETGDDNTNINKRCGLNKNENR